ncbi:Rab effector Noc2 [Eumeta japonica]|uniref:Rab effector Noc2 n=1 Tax=Eumeta variegata TaxID=151549 RepID=A0A4C2AC42_EUMVA|nr:Rab effector Noc2 [Eumeta japonica]
MSRRLRSGWSAARSDPPLSAAEREAIVAVVRRAERLDELEARRVGRLVARLEGNLFYIPYSRGIRAREPPERRNKICDGGEYGDGRVDHRYSH